MKFAILIAIALLTGCSRASVDDATVLTYGSPYGSAHPFSRADITWMKWVEKESHGRIRIQPYWSGSILSSEHSMTELRHGLLDIGLITPIYARGGAHLIRTQAGFYGGLTTFEQQVALYRCMQAHNREFDDELHGLIVLAVQGGNLPGIVTREKPVQSLEDLRGLRLRAPSELLPVLKYLGADPVDMPMGEVYSALAKGVLDGVVAPADALRSLHFADVAHYYNTVAIPRGAYAARAMNANRWRALSADERALLQRSTAIWEQALSDELTKATRAGEAAGHEHGMQFASMPNDDFNRFLSIYNEFAQRNANQLERFGIDGAASFKLARIVIAKTSDSSAIDCAGEN